MYDEKFNMNNFEFSYHKKDKTKDLKQLKSLSASLSLFVFTWMSLKVCKKESHAPPCRVQDKSFHRCT